STSTVWIAHHEHQGLAVVSSLRRRVRQYSVLDGLQTLSRPRSQHTGVTRSRLLSPTTPRSSSTEVTLGAPTPSPSPNIKPADGLELIKTVRHSLHTPASARSGPSDAPSSP